MDPLHPRKNNRDPVLVIRNPAMLSPTLRATFDRDHLGRALRQLDQLTITTELGEEIAMELHGWTSL